MRFARDLGLEHLFDRMLVAVDHVARAGMDGAPALRKVGREEGSRELGEQRVVDPGAGAGSWDWLALKVPRRERGRK